jgi:hypothetical protein
MSDSEKKITVLEYIVGVGSFIPFLGAILGVVSIILGAIKFKVGGWKLIALGVCGIFLTVALAGGLMYWAQKGAFSKNPMFVELARKNLRQDVLALEFYKQTHGKYPQTLEELAIKSPGQFKSDVDVYDCSAGMQFDAKKLQKYQYELAPDGATYHLFGVGPDGLPNTADDVFPDVSQEEMEHIGYRKK